MAKKQPLMTASVPRFDPSSSETLSAFKAAAKRYTRETTVSKAKAIATLKANGFLTPTGRLAKKYAKQS
jgi:hypothetical protein